MTIISEAVEGIVRHAVEKARRGRRPSLSFFGVVRNPMLALGLAKKLAGAQTAEEQFALTKEFFDHEKKRATRRQERNAQNHARHMANLAKRVRATTEIFLGGEEVVVIDGYDEFMKIAKLAVRHSGGQLRLAYQEQNASKKHMRVGHFLKLDQERLGADIETYSALVTTRGWEPVLVKFFNDVLLQIEKRLPKAYEKATEALHGLGF
ncbi:hypothetical protein A3I27_00595 [Candidatus Giovannonibacteria bacterium RIFCSPLOWO2_02_FULL_43_11b]|uniref:Uncharacterized protein n=1 Tax=Candidatus Giovannonibacteria bacterium RIFCSPHIGHO2_12_FULL_43_15 TaxID=1798341 RepID=A0A1F5WNQ1_9BACT|nr:MAG: hypothetical protein A3B97_02690 [Candidatus Giovannonibacteria bacterium RIFCSPHIGHO2_02_FULL_43_32]OGF77283.1 MAG: hypothetical protein A3F23_03995 [Candidatus Giovannonibacteria bacterium RIFCSPHIGHO2_12_FULL_43_15]OGF79150.1 MAG: hypothetical protein A3A15_01740 [Candidatus Giovannonibacteria bacterium RIFCSPLOWO2_01_FULL_43_60]OGF90154.1 MAG: hypothetical protein A3I27_00595 [Candidatus Giovannonibacteria bacterium RIFCSPLOWO2_02_FULL_43_11b]OGF92227.1 MAG: hypothetical protein A3H